MSQTLYLRCRPGDVAPLVLLTGDPARVDRIAQMLENPRSVSQNREFVVVSGQYRGAAVSAVSAGIGAPSTAIALEELAQLGVHTVVRLGTMMGLHAPMGSVVLSTGAARFEGTSSAYLPMPYPAIPNWHLVGALASAAQHHGLDVHRGVTATYDAFYPAMAPTLVGRGELDLKLLLDAGTLAMDMETSLLYILGMRLRLATAAMCLVTVQAQPHAALDADTRTALETRLITAALDGICSLDAE
jgi:uridine phosphorylase